MTVPTKEILADHLSQMIQMKTVSNSDVNKVDWSEFEKLHKLFETLYPHVYDVMEVDRVGQAGLQFHYHPKKTAKKPLLLMSHQDVVEIGDRSQWSHDPFSGLLLDGSVYGRGTTDCKHLVLSELEALESLFAEGFRPDYDLYLSLGYSEEVYLENDVDGAQRLVDHLAEKGVHIGTILDEGGGLFPEAGGRLAARIGLGEKAAVNYEIYCDRKGGHSSKPGNGTALGAVAKAVVAIEAHPFPYRLTPLVEAQLSATAPLKEEPVRRIYADPKGHFEELCALAQEDPALDAMLHTTVAFTMAQASTQPNVLPSHAAVGLSVRVLQGDTVESVKRRLQGFLPEGVKIRHISGKDPVPASTPDSDSYRLLTKILHAAYGDGLLAIPFLMLGATDTRYYKPITDTVLLFTGHVHDNRWGAAHQVNEHIPVDALPASVEFFREFLKQY
ncbi:M20/M25/M40 family metallo-hydrolase [uncultured Acidaminococcus sp.]|jgi:carboxypeptidase PM20D1|uniref:M20/M25/M40 family metallo-hydrolase n=1 Tax=uncultured Acidaminococcus sp. TaxID=352152 RepID=UPI0025CE1B4F|nr:M20/M25/M40 family metallo-hydrolase [uncultured Acidaminococcus sp.]